MGEDVLFPNFMVRSSGGGSSGLWEISEGVRQGGLELVNHISGNTSRVACTWARERHGKRIEGWWRNGRAGGEHSRTW